MQVLKKKNQKKTILNLRWLRELPPLISYSIADLKVSGLEEGVSGEIKVLKQIIWWCHVTYTKTSNQK